MQLDHPEWNHVFAIGDVANTSAIKAGHTGWYQAGVAAANIVKMVKDGDETELDEYTPTKPMIKVTVGKVSRVSFFSPCYCSAADLSLVGSEHRRDSNVGRGRKAQGLAGRGPTRRLAGQSDVDGHGSRYQ